MIDREQVLHVARLARLDDAGAVPFVKTNMPITLLGFELAKNLFWTSPRCTRLWCVPSKASSSSGALLWA